MQSSSVGLSVASSVGLSAATTGQSSNSPPQKRRRPSNVPSEKFEDEPKKPRKNKLQEEHIRLMNVEANLVQKMVDPRGSAGYRYKCLRCGQIRFERLRAVGHAANCGRKKTGKKRGKSKRKLKCYMCDQTESTVRKLSEHRRKVHGEFLNQALFKCTRCPKTFSHAQNFKIHTKFHRQGKEQFKCNLCIKTFTFLRNLKRHKNRSHLEKQSFPCQVCDEVCTTSYNLTRHIKIHHSGSATRYKCSQCTLEFSRQDNLLRHELKKHLEKACSEVEGGGGGGVEVSPQPEELSQYDHIRNSNICSITDELVQHLRSIGSTERQISFFVEAQRKKIFGSTPASTAEDTSMSSSPSLSVAISQTSSSAVPSRWDKFQSPTPEDEEPSSSLKSVFSCTICVGRDPFRDSYALKRHMKQLHGHWVSLLL